MSKSSSMASARSRTSFLSLAPMCNRRPSYFYSNCCMGKACCSTVVATPCRDAKARSGHDRSGFLVISLPNASRAQSELAKSRIGVVGSDGLRHGIVSALASVGIDDVQEMGAPSAWRTEPGAGPQGLDLIVACEVSPGFALFDAVNQACLATRTRWLRVAVSATSAQLGPTVVPYETACYTCLDLRRQTHEAELDGYLSYRAAAGSIEGVRDDGTAALSWVVSGHVALEITRIIVGHAPPATFGRYYEFSATSLVATAHDVLRVPRCSSCSRARSYPEAWDQTALPTVE
jgi:bacteriocin biosynthesis cyclodehydratase domain-containing protein